MVLSNVFNTSFSTSFKLFDSPSKDKKHADVQARAESPESTVEEASTVPSTLEFTDKGTMPYYEWSKHVEVEGWGWSQPAPSQFKVRSKTYLKNKVKQKCNGSQFQLVAGDWFGAPTRQSNILSRPDSLYQKHLASRDDIKFVFAVNIQVPAKTPYAMVSYFVSYEDVQPESLLGRFINGDDAFRNDRFKLIPHIANGPWVVQRSVGKTPVILGRAVQLEYYRGPNWFEVDIHCGSTTVARKATQCAWGATQSLVIDMAFLIEGRDEAELPEELIGTLRLAYLDGDQASEPPSDGWQC